MKHRYEIESLARGLKVLSLFSQRSPSLKLAEVVQTSGLTKTTAFRILKTLEASGYLEQSPGNGGYRPGLKVLTLGYTALNGLPLRDIAHPYLSGLAQLTNLTTSLSVLNQLEVIYIDRVRNRPIVNLMLGPGATVPAHCTSMGKVLMAGLEAAELGKRLDAVELQGCTSRSLVRKELLLQELEKVRRQGFAVNDGELAVGLRAVAAPIRDSSGATRAAINVAGTVELIDDRRLHEELPPQVTCTAAEISAYLSAGREATV